MELDHQHASSQQIIEFCDQAVRRNTGIVGGLESGNIVVQLSDLAVVKYGLGVTLQEAQAQVFAHENLDQRIVRVPQVYRFFNVIDREHWSVGYLVMEFIKGHSLREVDWQISPTLIRQVCASSQHINAVRGSIIGPVGGGQAHGPLWSEYGSGKHFESIYELQEWLNERLTICQESIDLSMLKLCLCHLDLAPRNMVVTANGEICILDWATAGFYPRLFEIWSLQNLSYTSGDPFFKALLQTVGETSPEDQAVIDKLHLVYGVNQRYTL
jgi:serine/threonine protein kinase